MNQAAGYSLYVTSAEEIVWGIILVAITLSMHGMGMILTLYASRSFLVRFDKLQPMFVGLATIILASWLIVLVHCIDVMVWAAFFVFWTGDMPNVSTAYHYAMLEYTTLGSSLNLPLRWRLLEGLIAIAGVLTFAWSTAVLLTLAQKFQEQQLLILQKRREKKQQHGSTPSAPRPGEG